MKHLKKYLFLLAVCHSISSIAAEDLDILKVKHPKQQISFLNVEKNNLDNRLEGGGSCQAFFQLGEHHYCYLVVEGIFTCEYECLDFSYLHD